MDKDAARKMVRETLEQPFDKGRFGVLARNMLGRFEDAPFRFVGNRIFRSFADSVDLFERLGKYKDSDGNSIDILIIRLKKETSLERARTKQRNFIARYLNGSRGGKLRDAALVAFVSPDDSDWRFSLVKMEYRFDEKGKVKQDFTPARRYSFLVGEHERSHTAQSRLVPLLEEGGNRTLAELEEAFSVEPVTEEFFMQYRALFVALEEALGKIVKKGGAIARDFKEKQVDTGDFAKKLLGQIVFLYFLQKKGWFGVARDAEWGEGSRRFLRELFERKHADYKNFFNDILEPLFYEALRRERDDDYFSRFNCKIPFLNGGLFDPMEGYDWIHADLLLDDALFSNSVRTAQGDTGTGVFDVFDRYNFTVNEDEPLEKEVAVDPEMLGKVFENLLQDKQSTGTYYTPREIVHYMCQESLINYLVVELQCEKNKEDIETLIQRGDVLVEHERHVTSMGKEVGRYRYKMPKYIRENAKPIDKELAAIRICDPAVGSGAFPVGMMNEIIRARSVLSNYIKGKANRTVYEFKRHAVENCLYGVDLDASAVDIAKLRLWLSLVVDEEDRKKIQPLPNLDYKIMCGDALLSREVMQLGAPPDGLKAEKDLFFNETNPDKKSRIKEGIDAIIRAMADGLDRFDFRTHFSEVFAAAKLEEQGFDVVIANPPYVRLQRGGGRLRLLYQEHGYGTFDPSGDIYQLFYEKGYHLLKKTGRLCFITSSKWMRVGYGRLSRLFLANTSLHAIVDFGELPVFKAGTEPAILLAQKPPPSTRPHYFTAAVIKNAEDIPRVREVVRQEGFEMDVSDLHADGWTLAPRAVLVLLEKVRRVGTPLLSHVRGRMYRGIIAGYSEALVIDNTTKNELLAKDANSADLIKPWLKGRDIKKWRTAPVEQHLILIESSANREWKWSGKESASAEKVFASCYPAVYAHLLAHKEHLENRQDQGVFWWELRSCAYMEEFAKPKIIYPDIAKLLRATYDKTGIFCGNTAYFLPTENLELLAILHSRFFDWYARNMFQGLGDPWRKGRLRYIAQNMGGVPIPEMKTAQKNSLASRAKKILAAPDSSKTPKLEAEIDKLVYKLYGLTKKEIQLIESRYKKQNR